MYNKNDVSGDWEYIRCNGLIYNLCNTSIITRHLIKKFDLIFDMFVWFNTSHIFFIRWFIIIGVLQRLYTKPW